MYSESTEEFSLDENWQSSESFPLLIGVIAGAVACALIIILVAMLLVRRFRKNKMDLKLVTKKEFTYNPQPYSLQYGHHLETAHRQMHFQQRLVWKIAIIQMYHKDLEKREDLRKCSLLVTVTLLWDVALGSLARHHTTTLSAFKNLHDI